MFPGDVMVRQEAAGPNNGGGRVLYFEAPEQVRISVELEEGSGVPPRAEASSSLEDAWSELDERGAAPPPPRGGAPPSAEASEVALVVDPSEVELGGAPTRERGGAGGDHKHRVSTAERVDLFFRSPLGEEEEAPDPAALEGAGGDDDVMWRDDEVPRAMNRDAGARTHARIVVASV